MSLDPAFGSVRVRLRFKSHSSNREMPNGSRECQKSLDRLRHFSPSLGCNQMSQPAIARIFGLHFRVAAVSALALLVGNLSACTSVIQYQAHTMDVVRAREVVEKLTMTQHPTWKPDYIEFNDTYMV